MSKVPAKSFLVQVKDKVSLLIYQYELTFGLYMLTAIEKSIFSKLSFAFILQDVLVLTFFFFSIYACYSIVPGQIAHLFKQASYYLASEDTFKRHEF